VNAARGCTGVILAGGAASRMGGKPKGLMRVGGLRIIDRVAAALVGATGRVIISANDVAAAEWLPGVPSIGDRHRGFGPLAGIGAALSAAGTDIIVLAWDMPLLQTGVLRQLRETGEAGEADIVAPASNSPWGFEPLCAWYSAAALPAIEAQIKAGDARPGALRDRAKVVTVDVSSWGDPDEIFFSVNTPADLARANQLAASREPIAES
jgi:molybdopterin-guanine dinucleotide biosynthesis protein A